GRPPRGPAGRATGRRGSDSSHSAGAALRSPAALGRGEAQDGGLAGTGSLGRAPAGRGNHRGCFPSGHRITDPGVERYFRAGPPIFISTFFAFPVEKSASLKLARSADFISLLTVASPLLNTVCWTGIP